jgi:hypothetical protein
LAGYDAGATEKTAAAAQPGGMAGFFQIHLPVMTGG